jgi:hypothetical protein
VMQSCNYAMLSQLSGAFFLHVHEEPYPSLPNRPPRHPGRPLPTQEMQEPFSRPTAAPSFPLTQSSPRRAPSRFARVLARLPFVEAAPACPRSQKSRSENDNPEIQPRKLCVCHCDERPVWWSMRYVERERVVVVGKTMRSVHVVYQDVLLDFVPLVLWVVVVIIVAVYCHGPMSSFPEAEASPHFCGRACAGNKNDREQRKDGEE